jgi:hypothetical protein
MRMSGCLDLKTVAEVRAESGIVLWMPLCSVRGVDPKQTHIESTA